MSKFKKLAASVGKVLLFVVLFLCIYNYTNDAFRGSNMHNAIPFLADQPDESYDVVWPAPAICSFPYSLRSFFPSMASPPATPAAHPSLYRQATFLSRK